jgi:hypothetical protein
VMPVEPVTAIKKPASASVARLMNASGDENGPNELGSVRIVPGKKGRREREGPRGTSGGRRQRISLPSACWGFGVSLLA